MMGVKNSLSLSLSLFPPAAGSDYDSQSQTVTFSSSPEEQVVSIPIRTDDIVEMEETFNLGLSTDDAMVTLDDPVTVTIVDQTKGMHV